MNITLFGSGNTLVDLISFSFDEAKFNKVLVCYAPRHENSICNDGRTLKDVLDKLSIKYPKLSIFCLKSLDDPEFDKLCVSDIQISLGSAWIFKDKHINKLNYLVHSHCTDLPKYRGGASTSWMLMSNYKKSATTIFRMNSGIDSGNLIVKDDFLYPNSYNTPQEYSDYTEQRLSALLKNFILDFCKNGLIKEGQPQNEESSTYFPRLSSEIHSWINWNWSCYDVVSFVRAFSHPYPGAKTRVTSKISNVLRIKELEVYEKDGKFHPFKNGIIYRINKDSIFVACAPYAIKIRNLIDNKLKLGDRLYTLSKDIDNANSTRVYFSPN